WTTRLKLEVVASHHAVLIQGRNGCCYFCPTGLEQAGRKYHPNGGGQSSLAAQDMAMGLLKGLGRLEHGHSSLFNISKAQSHSCVPSLLDHTRPAKAMAGRSLPHWDFGHADRIVRERLPERLNKFRRLIPRSGCKFNPDRKQHVF